MKIQSEDPIEAIKKSRPNLKDNSINQYWSHLKKLQSKNETEDWDFLSDVDKVIKSISDKHFTTTRNTLNAIIVLLIALNENEKYNDLIKQYTEKRDELNKQYQDEQATGKISDKQSPNFIKLEELENMINQLRLEISKQNLKQKKTFTPREKELLTVYTILSYLIRIPTRNDMAEQRLTTKSFYNKLSDEEKSKYNWLLREKGTMTAIYNNYKTQGKYGEKRVDIPADLMKILNSFIRNLGLKAGDFLFTNSKGNPFTRNMISQLLIKWSKRYLDKSISSTMIRKIVASHHFGDLKKQQKELAEKMGHDVSTQNAVYVKEK